MRIKDIEHVYTIDGTEQEVRDFKAQMYEKYEQVDIYPTPFDDRVVCRGLKVTCPVCEKAFIDGTCAECDALVASL